MHRVLLIRQIEEALPLAEVLTMRGNETYLYPLFKPRLLSIPRLINPQALIITSKNALRALERHENLKMLPLYTVGDQTADFAQSMGFSHVLSASGTSQELIQLVARHAHPGKGILWHLSGEIIKQDIVKTLQLQGFQAERLVVYFIEEIKKVSRLLFSRLQNQNISHVMFFSPYTTKIFINLLEKEKLEQSLSQTTALCLSYDVAKEASKLKWKKIWISTPPTMQNMIEYFNAEK